MDGFAVCERTGAAERNFASRSLDLGVRLKMKRKNVDPFVKLEGARPRPWPLRVGGRRLARHDLLLEVAP